MRPQDLSNVLATLIDAGLPALIKGAPGIGKTDIVKQAAAKCGADLLIMHPVVSDPTDFKGLPCVVDGGAEFLPFGDLDTLMTATEPLVAFLDDLGQAPAMVQAAAMQLILARQINGKAISDKVVFVAATNRREDRAGVTGILEPVKSRFATIIQLDVNLEDWCNWALANEVPPEIVAFVRFRPGTLTDPGEPTSDIVNRPSPRTVTNMAKLHKLGITSVEALGGAAGAGTATEFVAFLRVWQALPSIESILLNPDKAQVPPTSNPAALYAIATALAIRAEKKNVGNVIKYLSRLPDEFSVLGVKDTLRQCEAGKTCSEFVKWAHDHQDVLV